MQIKKTVAIAALINQTYAFLREDSKRPLISKSITVGQGITHEEHTTDGHGRFVHPFS